MRELTLSYDEFVHPDMEAIKKRDEFLSNDNINIVEMNKNGIVVEIENVKTLPH